MEESEERRRRCDLWVTSHLFFAWVREVVNIGSFFLFFLSDVAVRNQDEEDTAIRPRERRKEMA